MADHKSVRVEALKTHTFAGKEYQPGESYAVKGDEMQSTEQYLETLRATGLAVPAGEVAKPTADDAAQPATAPSTTAVKPMALEQPATTPRPKASTRTTRAGKHATKK